MGPLLRYSFTAWATRAGLSSTSSGGTLTTVTTVIDSLDGFAKLDFRARATP